MQKRTLPIYRHQPRLHAPSFKRRIYVLMGLSVIIFIVLIVRLFELQILTHEEYRAIAESQHYGATELPAKRGEIWLQDKNSGEFTKLATNTTLDLVYVDPFVAEEKEKIATTLAPLLFTEEEYKTCLQKPDECFHPIEKTDSEASESQEVEIENSLWNLDIELNEENGSLEDIFNIEEEEEEVTETINPKSYSQMVNEIAENFFEKISKEEMDFVVLKRDLEQKTLDQIKSEKLPGIFVNDNNFIVYGDPTVIPEGRVKSVAKRLSEILDESPESLEYQLRRRKVRYVFLKNRISPETSSQIKALKLKGVVLLPEHWRFYPEGTLASHLVGFVNRENAGQYGIEAYFDNELQGKKGTIYTKSDPFGGQIAGKDSEIVDAINGDTIILTIDRVLQQKVEEILEEKVEEYRADSAQVIIMNPFTGAILTMANSPGFDPNAFGEAYKLRKLGPGEEPFKTVPLFKKDERGRYLPYVPPILEDGRRELKGDIYVYENVFGPGVLKNKTISEFYEPGSVFKPLIMAAAIDAGEVRPETTFNDVGEIVTNEVPPRTIRNSDRQYRGANTGMVQVLEESLNTGMVFVSRKLGKKLMYKYLEKFGFGQYTDIRLEGETNQRLPYFGGWIESEQYNIAFGQSITVTALQLTAAWSALANGGKLVQPYIVDSVIHEGQLIKTKPKVLGRVISQQASQLISSMLVSVVRNGHGQPADIPGYMIAGKTGTAQIAGRGGWEEGEGSTYTSFVGYFPAMEPEFLITVKFDRPKIGAGNTWGSTTAAPVFGEIAQFLIDHYNILPE